MMIHCIVCLVVLVLLQTGFGTAQDILSLPGTQLFQCQPTTDQSGQVFTPNIPDLYFNASTIRDNENVTLERSETGFTHVYTIPTDSQGHNCSGTAVAVQYCYAANISTTRRLPPFNFLILDQDGLEFTVSRRIRMDRPQCLTRSLDDSMCCTTENLSSAKQFQISSSPFTFGILPRLALLYSLPTENSVRQYEATPDNGRQNTTFTATSVESSFLLVMRIIIEPTDAVATTPTREFTDTSSTAGTIELDTEDILSNSTSTSRDYAVIIGIFSGVVLVGGLPILVAIALFVLRVRRNHFSQVSTHPNGHKDTPLVQNKAHSLDNVNPSATEPTPKVPAEDTYTTITMAHGNPYRVRMTAKHLPQVAPRPNIHQDMPFTENKVHSVDNMNPSTIEPPHDPNRDQDIPLSQNGAYQVHSVDSMNPSTIEPPHDPSRDQDMPLTHNKSYQVHSVDNMNPSTIEPPHDPNRDQDIPLTQNGAYQSNMNPSTIEPTPEVPDDPNSIHLTQNEAYQAHCVDNSTTESTPEVPDDPNRNQDIHLTQNEAYQSHSVDDMNPSTIESTPEVPDEEIYTTDTMAGSHRVSFRAEAIKHLPQVAPRPNRHQNIHLTQNKAYQLHSVENMNQGTIEPPHDPNRDQDIPLTQNGAYQSSMNTSTIEPTPEVPDDPNSIHLTQNEAYQSHCVDNSTIESTPEVPDDPSRNQDIHLTQNEAYQSHSVDDMNPSTIESTPEVPDEEIHTTTTMAGSHRASFRARKAGAIKHLPQVAPRPNRHQNIPLTQNKAYQLHSVENMSQRTIEPPHDPNMHQDIPLTQNEAYQAHCVNPSTIEPPHDPNRDQDIPLTQNKAYQANLNPSTIESTLEEPHYPNRHQDIHLTQNKAYQVHCVNPSTIEPPHDPNRDQDIPLTQNEAYQVHCVNPEPLHDPNRDQDIPLTQNKAYQVHCVNPSPIEPPHDPNRDQDIPLTQNKAYHVHSVDNITAESKQEVPGTVPNDDVYTIPNDDVYTVPNDDVYTVPNDDVYTVPNDDVYTVPNDDIYTVPNDAVYTVPNDDVYTIPDDGIYTIPDDGIYTVPTVNHIEIPADIYDYAMPT